MRKRYQEGGAVDDAADQSAFGGTGALDPATMLSAFFMQNMTTTPEAQERARQILDQVMDDDTTSWDVMLKGKRDQAAQVRQALQTARQRLQAQEYNRGEMLLAASQALGAPTRTGALGETASNVFGALREPIAKRREFERGRDDSLMQLDLAEANADAGVTDAEFDLYKLREQIQGRMGEEAFRVLGKSTNNMRGWKGPIPPAAEALDAAYVKEHLPFIRGGDAQAAAGLDRLRFVADYLENGTDALTGPYIGAVASLPGIGEWVQGYVSPSSADIKNLLERTVQEDLRPTLGSQFTADEGQRLIARTYNMNLEEKRNAPRVRQLIKQMEAAYANRVAMARYFEENKTLWGFSTPKIGYTEGEFQFDKDSQQKPPGLVYRDMPPGPEKQLQLQLWRESHPGQEPPAWMLEGLAKGGRVRYQTGGPVRYQEGGATDFTPPPSTDTDFSAEPETTFEQDLQNLWAQYGDPVGAAVGTGAGMLGESVVDTIAQRRVGGRERRVADAITSGGLDPIAVANDIKRNQRAGVPETLMDTDTAGIRVLAQEAFKFGDGPAEVALRNLRERLEGSRERVNDRVNAGLKPDQYFDYESRISSRLANERTQEMKAAFSQYPEVAPDPVLSAILATPEGVKAQRWAMRFYANEPGRTPGATDAEGKLVKPSLEFYDYVRKGFNQTIAAEDKKGGGDPTDFSATLRNLRQEYLNRLDQISPEYATARAAQGDDLDIRDALRDGRRFMKLQPEQLEELAKTLPFHQRNAYRTGMAQNIYETLDRASGENTNAAQKIVGSPAMLARLEPFFDNAQQFRIFQTALEREAEMFRTGSKLLTMGDAARHDRELNRQDPYEYAIKRAGGMRYAVSKLGWALRLFNDRPKMTPKEAGQVLDVLRRGRPDEMNAFAERVSRLRGLRRTRGGRRAAGAAIGAGLGLILGNDDDAEE